MTDVVSLCDYRQEIAERACGVGRYRGVRLVDGKVVIATSLDDEALIMSPREAVAFVAHVLVLAEQAEREVGE